MTIGVGGLVSGLDTESIISQMMTLERRPVLLLQGRETDYQAKISALGTMKGGLAALQTAASSLADADSFVSFNATSGNTSVLTALAGADAAAGNYQVEVAALATAQQVRSAAFTVAASTADVGTGVLTIQVGANTAFNVTIDADHQTLAGIATAINEAGTDVSAAVVDDGKGSVYLTLASSETGAANTISLTVVEDTGTLSVFEPLVETQTAANAKLTLNGIDVERASNTITDLIGGVTLTLLETDPGSPFEVTVDQNLSTITSKVQSFVAKYNAMVSTFDSLLSYNPEAGTGGILQGDSTTRQLRSGLQNLLYGSVDGVASDVNGLNRLGIQVGRDGKLSVDSETLTAVVEENPDQVISFFSNDEAGNDGIGRRFDDLLEGYLHRSTGLLDSKENGLQASIEDIGNQVDKIEYRLSIREANLRKQFSNLETLLAGFQATQGALDQQLKSIDNLNASIYG
jgi:flagellar hook-associated protein 2